LSRAPRAAGSRIPHPRAEIRKQARTAKGDDAHYWTVVHLAADAALVLGRGDQVVDALREVLGHVDIETLVKGALRR
jgi:hypothetical protein